MTPFNVTVVGTINHDIIISQKGERKESLGGILYNILTLSEIGKKTIQIFPVTYIGSYKKEEFLNILKKHQNISTKGIKYIRGKININILEYINDNERKETTDFFTDEITYAMIKPFLSSDVLLFNFISGYDISIETIEKVRKNSNSIIFLDVHSLVLKKTKGERLFYPVKNWEKWVNSIDIIQMNTKELLFFTGYPSSGRKPNKKIIKEIISLLLKKGIIIVLITSGEEGVYLGYRNDVYFFKQKYKSVVKDTTGCGDIFSSSFLAKFLFSKDPFISCEYANNVSGLSTKDTGISKCSSYLTQGSGFNNPLLLFIRDQAVEVRQRLLLS